MYEFPTSVPFFLCLSTWGAHGGASLPVSCVFQVDGDQQDYLPGGADWLVSGDWLYQMCRTAETHIVSQAPAVMCRESLEHAQGIMSLLTDVSCLRQ